MQMVYSKYLCSRHAIGTDTSTLGDILQQLRLDEVKVLDRANISTKLRIWTWQTGKAHVPQGLASATCCL
jgi:hypothetical protein